MMLGKTGVSSALSALGDHLEQTATKPVELIVCGGSALQALGLVDRTTRDVDVLAVAESSVGSDLALLSAQPLPTAIVEAARIVARDLGLPEEWLNSGQLSCSARAFPKV